MNIQVDVLAYLLNAKRDGKDIEGYVTLKKNEIFPYPIDAKELRIYDISPSTRQIFVYPIGHPTIRKCISPYDPMITNLRFKL